MSPIFFCLICLDDKKELKNFEKYIRTIKKFNKTINKKYMIENFFGCLNQGNDIFFNKVFYEYTGFLIKNVPGIKFRIYSVVNDYDITLYKINGQNITKHSVKLNVSISYDDKTEKLNEKSCNLMATLDSFTPPYNITILINEEYGFDNIDV